MTKRARKAAIKSAAAERTNKRIAPQMDAKGRYAAACLVLSVELGRSADETYELWVYLALMRRYEQGLPQAAAEDGAWRDVRAMLEKDGEGAN